MPLLLIILIVFLSPPLKNELTLFSQNEFIVWNVGQGQWATYIAKETCTHFDAGGEFAPFRKIHQACRHKKNEFWISHWDQDHFIFLTSKYFRLTHVCLHRPYHPPKEKWKTKRLSHFPDCDRQTKPFLKEVFRGQKTKNTNSESQVLVFKDKFLLPGDSTSVEEKLWRKNITPSIRVLILGHHGSKTSTSTELLKQLPLLKMSVASARRAKYKHPHPIVRSRLSARGVPLLQTEKWGHLRFEIED